MQWVMQWVMQGPMQWIKDKGMWIVLFTAIAAVSSTYSACKIQNMTDMRAATTAPAKGKR